MILDFYGAPTNAIMRFQTKWYYLLTRRLWYGNSYDKSLSKWSSQDYIKKWITSCWYNFGKGGYPKRDIWRQY